MNWEEWEELWVFRLDFSCHEQFVQVAPIGFLLSPLFPLIYIYTVVRTLVDERMQPWHLVEMMHQG